MTISPPHYGRPDAHSLECLLKRSAPAEGFESTVAIVTRNRHDDVVKAIRSALDQSGVHEVLVICDGDRPEDVARLESDFPDQISLYSGRSSSGYILRRNQAAALAQAPVLVSLDDDSVFTDRATVTRVLKLFNDRRIGAVAMPYINVTRSQRVLQHGQGDPLMATDRYVGTAHALRLSDFELVNGYREVFVHAGEEADLCLRLLAAGRLTVLADTPPIHHFESSVRDPDRIMYFARQNDILFAAWNVPWPYLVVHLGYTTVHGALLGFRLHAPRAALAGLVSGYMVALRSDGMRAPVDRQTYRLHRQLRKRGARPAGQVLARLTGARGATRIAANES